jgi:hypothetical protein
MQAPIKHQTSLKSTNPDRSENKPIRKLGGKNQPMMTKSGMLASIKHQPWPKQKSTYPKAWREKPANDWPSLECRLQSNTSPDRSENQPIRKLGGKN